MPFNPGLTTGTETLTVQLEDSTGGIIDPATETTLRSVAGFNIPKYDYVGVAYSNPTTEVWVFKTGGAGGTTVGTLTLIYVDSSKNQLSSVTKS